MDTPIIVPRDLERVFDFEIPAPLVARMAATDGPCGLTIHYLAGGTIRPAATHDLPPGERPTRLRKRLPPPPPALDAIRLAFSCDGTSDTDHVDLPAIAPEFAYFARGSLTVADLPDEFAPDAVIRLPLTLTNDSSFVWQPEQIVLRLDYDGEITNLPLPAVVAPGECLATEITVKAPPSAGQRALTCTPVLHPALPFVRGRTFKPLRLTLTIAAPERGAPDQPHCRIDIAPPDHALLAGEPAILLLALTNTGATRIEASGPGCLRLRARWRREPREGAPIRDVMTTLLPYPIEPGATATIALDVTAPPDGGRYKLDILAERVGYHSRLDDRHSDCPPALLDVANPEEIEKPLERTLRRESHAAARTAERLAYRDWAATCDTLDADQITAMIAAWPRLPRIAIALPDAGHGEEAHAFLESQPYPAWQLEPTPETDLILPWNPAEGRLALHALAFIAGEFLNNPHLTRIYADYDHIGPRGRRHDRVHLPAPDPFFARAQPAMFTIAAYAPHATGNASAHIPDVLFHRYDTAALPHEFAHQPATDPNWRLVKMHDVPGYAARPVLRSPTPRVALIIPTRDRRDLLATFVGGILERTDYPTYELIVIDNGSEEPETLAYLDWLQQNGIAKILRDDGPFNWSRLNNAATGITNADIFCFLNNDMEVMGEGWLTELAALAANPEVGVAGATLWFPDGTIQHAGVAFTAHGGPMHLFRNAPRGTAPFYLRSLRTQPAVTGACLAVRREIFEAVGGFDEIFPLGFNDIDFCMRVREQLGLPSVCTPAAELLHKESASRGRLRGENDRVRFLKHLAFFEGRHMESALADRWTDTVAHAARRGAPLTMVARRPQGVRVAARRYMRRDAKPVAFIHIPKTAGTAVREALDRALPDGAVLSLGARAVTQGHAGDAATAVRLAPLLRNTEVLVSHISHGFGLDVGWDCRYATLLRDPRARARSHHGFLVSPPNAPLQGTPLADWPLADLIRKGVIPANLMLSKILGEAPETVGWPEIDGRYPRYAGFRLPPALWRGDTDALAALPDITPDTDESKVTRALAIIERDFLFVGLQEQMDDHLAAFGRALHIPDIGTVPRVNVSRDTDDLSSDALAAIDTYNALDRLLYEAISARPGGLHLNR